MAESADQQSAEPFTTFSGSLSSHAGKVHHMFMRVDKLQIELPAPKKQDPNAAAALQAAADPE